MFKILNKLVLKLTIGEIFEIHIDKKYHTAVPFVATVVLDITAIKIRRVKT